MAALTAHSYSSDSDLTNKTNVKKENMLEKDEAHRCLDFNNILTLPPQLVYMEKENKTTRNFL